MPRVAPSSPRVGVVNTKLGQSARLRYANSRAEISELKGGLLNGSLVQIKDVAAKVATEYSEVLKNSWALTEPLFVNEPDKHGLILGFRAGGVQALRQRLGVAEWAHAWKVCMRETVSRVRIPLPPPVITYLILHILLSF